MIKIIISMGAATIFTLASLTSCSSTNSTINSNEELGFKSTNDFKPEMTYRFSKFDTSLDGQVNFSEWKKGLNRMLKEFDKDGNGSLEQKKGEITHFYWMQEANKNEDDVINPLEINKGLKEIFKKASGTNSLISKREFKTFNWVTGESFAKRKKSKQK
jgi:hypothetical protein